VSFIEVAVSHYPQPTLQRHPISSVSVVISAYTLERWHQLVDAVGSVTRQSHPDLETIVVVDHNPVLLSRANAELDGTRVVANTGPRGLSGARNSGIAVARGNVVVFLDDDAEARPGWLAQLLEPYRDPRVMGVGGRVDAAWHLDRPVWFPREFDWVVGCTYLGLPSVRSEVRNVIGANMSFRREVFDKVGGFTNGIGRVGTLPAGCEETELCIRARRGLPLWTIVYEPDAEVRHHVPPQRARARYFLSRCLAEGRSKAALAGLAGAGPALETERRYVTRVLPAGVLRNAVDTVRGDPAGLARTTAIVFGLLLTALGFAAGWVEAEVGTPRL